ncbi:DUF2510 domain-containing protein, partial [Mycobacterium sp. 1081908.1]|uniref:DUF2510 domain-containing protein n=1 Tax=Mycobacterium sp. 1081908.1 TaxID=1834066 RepID=UPI0012EA0B80
MTTPNRPGWYDDPQDPSAQRYWDGRNWTPQRQRKPDPRAARPPVTPAQQPPSAAPTQVTPLQPPPPRPNLPPSAAQTRAARPPPLPPRQSATGSSRWALGLDLLLDFTPAAGRGAWF